MDYNAAVPVFMLGFACGALVIHRLERRLKNGTSDFPAEAFDHGNNPESAIERAARVWQRPHGDDCLRETECAGMVSPKFAGKS